MTHIAIGDMRIVTERFPRPFLRRSPDWSAVTENYEPGYPIGMGFSEFEAVRDLIMQIERMEVEGVA